MTQLANNDLDNMFIRGLTGLTAMSLTLGAMGAASQMLPPAMAPAMKTFMGMEVADSALRMTQSLYQQQRPQDMPKPNGPTGMG